MKRIILLINCKDQKGIIAETTNCVQDHGGNIVYIDQHVDHEKGVFFMRLESDFDTNFNRNEFEQKFRECTAIPFAMKYQLFDKHAKPNMAIFVSKYSHCLYDLLSRYSAGELHANLAMIVSNHDKLKVAADQFGVPFHHIPVSKSTKVEAEQKQLELLKKQNIELVVLARYMQILSGNFVDQYSNQIINIHHSFLPAFPGAKPYHSAYERGVKIIGATSHYVTTELDAGPIIEQETVRVSHEHSIEDFIHKGRDLEKIVLSRAIKAHLNRKTMVCDNRTVIFT